MRKFETSFTAKVAVRRRSGGMCEHCGREFAIHFHHVTYERAGHESPEDLLDLCARCHAAQHPEKYEHIFAWEWRRRANERSKMTEEEREREREQEERTPALNLGRYESSGYCLDDVEREEQDMSEDHGIQIPPYREPHELRVMNEFDERGS